ncbi:MAG TPA: hypothetical protein VFB38_10040 [Chthonomonadaceae bacterium]|nr:hypothetical protein [Chthonomonadaceae bacterium]
MAEDATRRIQEELRQIAAILEEVIGRESNWNRELYLIPNADFLGKKPFDCRIELDDALVNLDVRWRTLIHEILHSFSEGYNLRDYNQFYGWEEGVVERLQRIVRPQILFRLGIIVAEETFASVEAGHPFNPYIEALERIRQALNAEAEQAFYLQLLKTPIRERHSALLQMGIRMGGARGKRVLAAVSAARSVLERRVR